MLAMCVYVGLYAQENSRLFSARPNTMFRKCIGAVCLFVNCQIGKARWTLSEVSCVAAMGIKKTALCRINGTDCKGSDTSRRTGACILLLANGMDMHGAMAEHLLTRVQSFKVGDLGSRCPSRQPRPGPMSDKAERRQVDWTPGVCFASRGMKKTDSS